MKNISKLLRIVAIATILSLLVVALPATPALAESIDVDPEKGEIGDEVEVTGSGFNEEDSDGYNKRVDIYFTSENGDIDDIDDLDNYEKWSDSVGSNDKFDKTITIPSVLRDGDDNEDVLGGDYYFYVTYIGDDDVQDVFDFTVIAAEMELSTDEGFVGDEVEITGKDFEDREDITVEYDGYDVDIESGDDETDSDGEFSLTIIVPESTAGDHTITVTAGDSETEVEFTVEPQITVDPTSGAAGDVVTVKGTGFGKDVGFTIEFGGTEVQSYETDRDGSFEATFKVPVMSPDTYKLEAKDNDKNKASVNFATAAAIRLSPITGNVGSQVTITGSGFTPNTTVTITYGAEATPIATPPAEANGKFSTNFTVPKSTHGKQTITASDGVNPPVTASFTMESTRPPIPAPLLPIQDEKVKSRAFFDWEDATDPSGVTYTLQIATDDQFTKESILLEETDIADSEYTLTKDDPKLTSTKKDAPNYWRVQAVDGAGNESGWTAPGPFYTGFTFDVAGPFLYVLMGLAALILFLIGFLLGRKGAY